jgi:hypothetical protein
MDPAGDPGLDVLVAVTDCPGQLGQGFRDGK